MYVCLPLCVCLRVRGVFIGTSRHLLTSSGVSAAWLVADCWTAIHITYSILQTAGPLSILPTAYCRLLDRYPYYLQHIADCWTAIHITYCILQTAGPLSILPTAYCRLLDSYPYYLQHIADCWTAIHITYSILQTAGPLSILPGLLSTLPTAFC